MNSDTMEMREKIGSKEYFDYSLSEKQWEVDMLNGILTEKSPDIPSWARIHSGLSFALLRMIFLHYSMGADKAVLKELTEKALEHYIQDLKINDDEESGPASSYIGVYEDGLRLLSLAKLLELDAGLIAEFKALWDEVKGKDGLMDAIFSPGTTGGKLIYPKLFENLYKVFSADPSERPQQMKNYLENWYDTMKKSDWHNTHKTAKVNGAANFYGYWCFEAAAVTRVLGIDDTSYRDLAYYPKDI